MSIETTSEPVFSIVTWCDDPAARLSLTAKSLVLQQDAPLCEWIVIGANPQSLVTEECEFIRCVPLEAPAHDMSAALNAGLERATGRYVWFLSAATTLSDIFTLRDMARSVRVLLWPDFVCGDAREAGALYRAGDLDGLSRGMVVPQAGMLYRRALVGALRFDAAYGLAADYAFTLKFQELAQRIELIERVLCDVAITNLSAAQAEQLYRDTARVRTELLGIPPWKNAMLLWLDRAHQALKRRRPALYRKLHPARRKRF